MKEVLSSEECLDESCAGCVSQVLQPYYKQNVKINRIIKLTHPPWLF